MMESSSYSKSKENELRSIHMYFAHGICGKRRYDKIRKSNKLSGGAVPNYVLFKKISKAKMISIFTRSPCWISAPL